MRKRIPYHTIAAAKDGDGEAVASILHHYDDYINYYSRREVVEKNGTLRLDVNEDVRQHVTTKLIIANIHHRVLLSEYCVLVCFSFPCHADKRICL